jgi:hypothetical protein
VRRRAGPRRAPNRRVTSGWQGGER